MRGEKLVGQPTRENGDVERSIVCFVGFGQSETDTSTVCARRHSIVTDKSKCVVFAVDLLVQ